MRSPTGARSGILVGVMPEREKYPSVRELIARIGVVDVGRRYVAAMRVGEESDEYWAVESALRHGRDGDDEPLPVDLRWELACASLDACETDEDFWRLGDGAFSSLWFEDGVLERMMETRASNPNLRRLYAVMRRRLQAQGLTDGWWFH